MCKWWALLFFLFISTTPSFGQATSSSTPAQGAAATVARTVRVDATPPDAPFKIVRVVINSAEVEPDVPLQGGDDWFNQIRVVIKNTSRKNLVYATGQLRRVPLSFCVILTRQQRLDRLQDEFLVLLRHPRGENGSSIFRSSAVALVFGETSSQNSIPSNTILVCFNLATQNVTLLPIYCAPRGQSYLNCCNRGVSATFRVEETR